MPIFTQNMTPTPIAGCFYHRVKQNPNNKIFECLEHFWVFICKLGEKLLCNLFCGTKSKLGSWECVIKNSLVQLVTCK